MYIFLRQIDGIKDTFPHGMQKYFKIIWHFQNTYQAHMVPGLDYPLHILATGLFQS